MEKPFIRRYQASDFEEVKKLHRVALELIGAYVDDFPRPDLDIDNIEDAYLKEGDFLLGFLGDVLVVMGALRKIDQDTAEIKRMRVRPEYQRKGYGQLMLELLETRARELGYKRIILDTGSVMIGAQHFYLKNGYRETRRERHPKIPFDSIFYEKDLAI